MARIRSKDTKPEIRVRKLLHAMGYRFRLHRKDLPGTPDIVIPKFKTIIFVHGCFWHGHSKCDRGTRVPQTRTDFWVSKVKKNRQRDEAAISELNKLGWRTMVIWECETKNVEQLVKLLSDNLAGG